jgi:hypothetical protein
LALLDRYVGYLSPYATSHDDLDRDTDFQEDVRNAARTLVQAVKDRRSSRLSRRIAACKKHVRSR